MLNRSKLAKSLQFFSKRKTLSKIAEGIAAVSGVSTLLYNGDALKEKWIKHEIKLFKSRLTESEKKEMESSPEKNKEFFEKFKDEIRAQLRPD